MAIKTAKPYMAQPPHGTHGTRPMQPWKTWRPGCRPIWSLSIFVTVIFFVGTCRLDSEPLQIFISRWPLAHKELGMGKLSCWEMGMGMDAERE